MIRVSYNGLIADIRDADLKDAIASLSSEPENIRKQILQSVLAALVRILVKLEKNQKISVKEMQDTANDICLWFANETIEGRAEQYKQQVQ